MSLSLSKKLMCLVLLGAAVLVLPSSATSAAPKRPLTIAWVGDIVVGTNSYGLPPDYGRDSFRSVLGPLARADVAIGNLEQTLSQGGVSKCGSGSANCFAFQAPPAYAAALVPPGFDVLNLANNHANDFGSQGLRQTRQALSRRGIAATGGPGEIALVRVDGRRVAVVGFASYPWSASLTDLNAVKRLVRQADARAELVVATFHGGAEGADKTHVPKGPEYAFGENRGDLRRFARAAIDAGADLVVGSGPHVVRGLELYRGRLIAYSLGNFAGYNNFSSAGVLGLSGVLSARLGLNGRFLGGRWLSTRLVGPGLPRLDPSHASAQLVGRLSREDFGARAPRMNVSGWLEP